MNEHAPTTNQVRRVYSLAPVDLVKGGKPNRDADYAAARFDRWLTAHDAAVWDEGAKAQANAYGMEVDTIPNPYREPERTSHE